MPFERMQQRRDTTARWASLNPVLLDGELGYDTDVERYRVGNGVDQWLDLPWADRLEDSLAAVADAQAQVALAESAAAAAQAAADQAEDVSGITTTDDAVAYVGQHGEKTLDVLGRGSVHNHKHPLGRALDNINNYQTKRVFRVLLTATSIGNFDPSGIQVAVQQMANELGDSAYSAQCLGVFGGNYSDPYQGWVKQRYGGNQFTRLVGLPTSDDNLNLLDGYFDTITLECSRETDSESVQLLVDGAVVGVTTGPGAQAYRRVLTATVPLGHHQITLKRPTTGRVYAETLIVADSTRRDGVEVLNYGLGGTGLQHMTTLYNQPATPPMIDGIPIVGNAGRDYYFNRDDVDLFIIEGPVNDGGNTDAMATLDFAVEQARLRGIPVIIVIEPMSSYPTSVGYQAARNHMIAAGLNEWVTVVDWHGMLWPGTDLLDSSLTAKMIELYFPGGAPDPHPSNVAHQILTAALMRVLTLQMPTISSASILNARRLDRARLPLTPGREPQVTIAGHTYTLPEPEGVAKWQLAGAGPRSTDRDLPYYRLPVIAYQRDLYQVGSTAFLESPTGTDEYGAYTVNLNAQGYVTTGQLLRITARVRCVAGEGQSPNIRLRVPNAGLRLEDDKGNQTPPTAGTPVTDSVRSITPGEPPIVITWLVRVTNDAASYAPGLDGANVRIYEATCYPVASASVPPILSSFSSSYGFLRELPAGADRPTGVVLAGKTRRYTKSAGAAFELRAASAAVDLYPGDIFFDGEPVPFFRDTTAPQLGKADAGDGAFTGADANTAIAASGTSDTQGPYINNFAIGWTATAAGQEYNVLVRTRGVTFFRAQSSDNAQLIVNGVVRTGTVAAYYGTDDVTSLPFFYSVRVRAIAAGLLVFRMTAGRTYEVHAVEATHPIKTT